MEKNKVLSKEEEEQVNGGTSADFPSQQLSVICPNCKTLDVTAKAFTFDENNKLMVVYQCNFCGNTWEIYPKPIEPGYEPLSKV